MSAADNYTGPRGGPSRGAWRAKGGASPGPERLPTGVRSVNARAAALGERRLVCSCGWKGKAAQLGDDGCPRCESDEGLTEVNRG